MQLIGVIGTMNIKDRLYIASVSEHAVELAREYGIGLELDHYCMAENMEMPNFSRVHAQVLDGLRKLEPFRTVFHAPFNELYPGAIDPKVKEIAYERYNQAFRLAWETYGSKKMVVHSGYVPHVYYKVWHHERSVEFWTAYMKGKPENFQICIENVMEDEPDMMRKLVEELSLPNISLCLDLGHANCMGQVSIKTWIQVMGPYISHVHLHNNGGLHDDHGALQDGRIHMEQALEYLDAYCNAKTTMAIESLDGRRSLEWLDKKGYL